jgi:hypothetical protein
MASAILTNTSAMAAIGTTPAAAKVIKLDKNKLVAGGFKLCQRVDKLVVFATLGGAVSSGTAWLYWDAECDHLAAGPITLAAVNTLTTASRTNLYALLNFAIGPASNDRVVADAGCIYLVLAVNANTIDVAATDVELFTSDDVTASQ